MCSTREISDSTRHTPRSATTSLAASGPAAVCFLPSASSNLASISMPSYSLVAPEQQSYHPTSMYDPSYPLGTETSFSSLPGSFVPPCTCHLRHQHNSKSDNSFGLELPKLGLEASAEGAMTEYDCGNYTTFADTHKGFVPPSNVSVQHEPPNVFTESQSLAHDTFLQMCAPPAPPAHSCAGGMPVNAPTLAVSDISPGSSARGAFHPQQQHAARSDAAFPFPCTFPSTSDPLSSCSKHSSCISCFPSSLPEQKFPSSTLPRQRPERVLSRKRLSDAPSSDNIQSEQTNVKRIRAADGSAKQVVAISRMPYVRPQQPKKFCTQCADYPDGFRGEHELRRHVERAHAREGRRKMWICVDKDPEGRTLAACRKCRSGKKYGAYYNAAAHLRRAHFNPRERGRGKRAGDEPRGGKGGGDDPPMHELKQFWIKEVEDYVPVDGLQECPSPDAPTPQTDLDTPSPFNTSTFLGGHCDADGLSLYPLSPGAISAHNLAPSFASLSSSEDSQVDPFWSLPTDVMDTDFTKDTAFTTILSSTALTVPIL